MGSVNNTARTICGKLYLDSKTADLNFTFGTGPSDRVPAHKSILLVGSPVFETMFYGSLVEKGDVQIVDATAAEFTEFLQFFYVNNVQLTHKNVVKVTYLCKKYEMTDALQICGTFFQQNLSVNDVCEVYSLTSFLELESFAKTKFENKLRGFLHRRSTWIAAMKIFEKYWNWYVVHGDIGIW